MDRRGSLRQELSSALLRALIHQTRTGAQSSGPLFSPSEAEAQRGCRCRLKIYIRVVGLQSWGGKGTCCLQACLIFGRLSLFSSCCKQCAAKASHHPLLLSALLITSLGWISRKRITGSKDWTVFKTLHPHRPAPALLLESLAFFPTLS